MDEQHAVLMDTLNEIRLALVRGVDRDQVSEGLNRLIEFTRMHFASEEQLLEKHGFPAIAEHRTAHQKLLGQLEDAALRTHHNDEIHVGSMLLFLRNWYSHHIADLDHQYGEWLNARGIS
jgi:hemerythrin-like metal-binding protein